MIITRTDCEKILPNRKVLSDFAISKYSDELCGFFSENYKLTLHFRDEISGVLGRQTFFFKTIPEKMSCHKEYTKNMGVFRKEILMYKDILNELSKLMSKQFAPNYFYSITDKFLVLEDMRLKGYKNCKTEYLDFDKMKAALGAIARLHAASIVFEEQRSINGPFRINEQFPEALSEATFSFDETKVRYFWCQIGIRCLEEISVYFSRNVRIASKLRKYFFSEDGFKKFLLPSEKYRNVICHDDLWCNNFIFDDKNDCILVDFQLTRYTPPVCDVLLALHINLDSEVLAQNMNKFLDCYYDFLSYELSLNNISASKVIPKSEFFASAEDFKLPILIECGLYGTNVFLPEHLSLEIVSCAETFNRFYMTDRAFYILKEFHCNAKFRKRYSQVLTPLFEILEKML
nr:uncharacterized protein LOC111502756 [Leptinotarsa decemlineata]